jgi:Carboxylesterase family
MEKNVAFVILLFVFQTMSSAQDSELPAAVVETDLGRIQGTILVSLLEKQFYAFRGIRYGKAPVEELRFQVMSVKFCEKDL